MVHYDLLLTACRLSASTLHGNNPTQGLCNTFLLHTKVRTMMFSWCMVRLDVGDVITQTSGLDRVVFITQGHNLIRYRG